MSKIKPALTAEEWKALACKDGWIERDEVCIDGMGFLQNPHAIAALCLHKQPFGFTHKDVELLDSLVGEVWSSMLSKDAIEASWEIHSLISRIKALLPPQDQE